MPLLTLLEHSVVIAGHSDSVTGNYREGGGAGGPGGIGAAPLVAVGVLALLTVALLVWLNRRAGTSGEGQGRSGPKLGTVVPAALMGALIVGPLVVWTASSGGDEKTLVVERATSLTGAPELIVSLVDKRLNRLKTTSGATTVRLVCRDGNGHVVVDARHKWPFVIREAGYDYPHLHHPASADRVERTARCQLRGTRVRLEAAVEGILRD
jgi:hypothetical protein